MASNTNKPGGVASATITLPRKVSANNARLSDPEYRREPDSQVIDKESSYINKSVKDIRQFTILQAIRILTRFDSNFSSAVSAYIKLGVSAGYKVGGYEMGTHQFDPAATLAAMSLIGNLETTLDYSSGFQAKQSLSGLIETLMLEVMQTGGCMTELVINKMRLPETLVAVPIDTNIKWYPKKDGSGVYPEQINSQGERVPLDIPTVFYASSCQTSYHVFPRSQFEPALNMLYRYSEFCESIFKVLERTGHSRMVVTLIQEAVRNQATPEVLQDDAKLQAFFDEVRASVQENLAKLNPEDVIVTYDNATVSGLANSANKNDYTSLLETLSGMMASSLKTMPSILGLRIGGSQSLSNTESMVFLKFVEAMRTPVETVISRALTLATRLVTPTSSYIEFRFNKVELRPDAELSAHRSVDEQRILRMLSLGLISDEYAAWLLDYFPLPPGAPKLSGTNFMAAGDKSSGTQPKDMNTQDGAQQGTLNENDKKGTKKSNGGGNPAG